MYTTNHEISRRVYRALKTPSDNNPRTDPILAFHFDGKDDYIMMRCNKAAEMSIKGKPLIVYFSKESSTPIPWVDEVRFSRIGDVIR